MPELKKTITPRDLLNDDAPSLLEDDGSWRSKNPTTTNRPSETVEALAHGPRKPP